jgi:hypothetical protein
MATGDTLAGAGGGAAAGAMIGGPWGALAGALLGIAKGELIDRPKEGRQRKLASETQRFSPWTGLTAGGIQEADPFGSAMQGGTTALALGQGMQNADSSNALRDAQRRAIESGRSSPFAVNYVPGGWGSNTG